MFIHWTLKYSNDYVNAYNQFLNGGRINILNLVIESNQPHMFVKHCNKKLSVQGTPGPGYYPLHKFYYLWSASAGWWDDCTE